MNESILGAYKDKLIGGMTPFEIATAYGVTEPTIRKALKLPNADIQGCQEYTRRIKNSKDRKLITDEIYQLYEAKFITPEHTSELIESLIVMSDSRQILELGMYSGFTTLHMLRAIVGKSGSKVTSIDARPAHDREFFARPEISPWFEFIQDWTPQCLTKLIGKSFDLVFVDSDHSLDHCEKELAALLPITHSGSLILFHDTPKHPGNIYAWLEHKVFQGILKGLILPTAPQQDVDKIYPGDNRAYRPNLGVFIRP